MRTDLQSEMKNSSVDMTNEFLENNIVWDDCSDWDHSNQSVVLSKVPPTGISSIQLFEKIHQLNQMKTLANIRKYLVFIDCVASLELK